MKALIIIIIIILILAVLIFAVLRGSGKFDIIEKLKTFKDKIMNKEPEPTEVEHEKSSTILTHPDEFE